MSFALVRQNKNKEADSKSSTPAKPSPPHHIDSLAMDSYDSIVDLQRTIGNQPVQKLRHSDFRFDFAKIDIQAKLKVSQPGDVYEQEADRVAEKVMRMSASDHIGPRVSTDEERIDDKCSGCKVKNEEDGESLSISRKPLTTSILGTADETANEIRDVRSSGGSSLDASTKQSMESRFGFDFGRVRIHADDNAARSSETVNALAYTVGNDIVFGQGQYSPHTKTGQRLIAHELTHTIQQNSYGISPILQRQPGPPNTAAAGKKLFWKLLALREAMLRGNSEVGQRFTKEMNRFTPEQRLARIDHIDNELRNLSKDMRGTLYNYGVKGQAGRALETSAAGHIEGDVLVRSGFSSSPSSGVNDPLNFHVEFRSDNSARGAGIEKGVAQHYKDARIEGMTRADAKREAVKRVKDAKAARSPSALPERVPLPPDPPKAATVPETPTHILEAGETPGHLPGVPTSEHLPMKPGEAFGLKAGEILEGFLPGAQEYFFLMVGFFKEIAEGAEQIREEGFSLGFSEGLAASLLEFTSTWVDHELMITSYTPSIGERVAGYEGIRPRAGNKGKREGYNFGQSIGDKIRFNYRAEAFAAIKKSGQNLNVPFSRDDVITIGVALLPRVKRELDEGAARMREEEDRRRREKREVLTGGMKF